MDHGKTLGTTVGDGETTTHQRVPMIRKFRVLVTVAAQWTAIAGAGAQVASPAASVAVSPVAPVPPVRPMGPVIRMTAPDLLGSVSSVRPLPGGRLIVNDVTRHRVVLFDSTLTKVTIVADSTSASGGMFGVQLAGIIPFTGDSTLFVDPQSLSMLVIDGAGKTGRVMAIPRPQDAMYLVGGPFGTPGFDPQGRLVYRGLARSLKPPTPPTGDIPFAIPVLPDSAPVVRINLESRKLDTIGSFKVMKAIFTVRRSDDGGISIQTTLNPMMTLDDWALLPDGTVAFVRGSDFRVDWVTPEGVRTSTPKIPFDWQRLTDDDRAAVLDSARTAIEKQRAIARERMTNSTAPVSGAAAARAGGDIGAAPRGAAAASQINLPTVSMVPASELPDYRPAFQPGASRGDTEGNLWIRTSKMVNNGAVYDVINRKGELIDRVLVPQFRIIAGFGAGGIVYMGVLDGTAARLEEAKVR